MQTRCFAGSGFAFFGMKENRLRNLLSGLAIVGLLGGADLVCANEELIQKKGCFACHQMDKRKYGPNFKEVAAKYVDQKKAVDVLAKKIRGGGKGVWGPDPMPPQPQVTPAEARTLATFVLSLKSADAAASEPAK